MKDLRPRVGSTIYSVPFLSPSNSIVICSLWLLCFRITSGRGYGILPPLSYQLSKLTRSRPGGGRIEFNPLM